MEVHAHLASPHGARNVRVFGSIARGDNGADSDIDVLVDVESGRTLLDVMPSSKISSNSSVNASTY